MTANDPSRARAVALGARAAALVARAAALGALAAVLGTLAFAALRPPEAAALVCGKPSIGGAPAVGQPLTASAGACLLPASTLTLEWYRCADSSEASCTAVVQTAAASPSTYTPTAADAGRRVGVKQVFAVGLVSETSWTLSDVVQPAAVPPPPPPPPPGGSTRRARRPLRLLSPFPVVTIDGRLTNRGARITKLAVRAPAGSTVVGRCRGGGCPPGVHRRRIGRGHKLRLARFERHLLGGALLDLVIAKRGFVGKFTRFQFRRRRAPLRTDLCVVPGASRATSCPR